jgi:outer membrane protein TolC
LPLEEALQLARQNNLQLRKQEQKQKQAELEVAIKRGQLLPSVEVSATAAYTSELAQFEFPFSLPSGQQPHIELHLFDRKELSIGVRQPIFTGWRLNTQVALAKTAQASEQTRLTLLQQQTAYQVYLLFYQAENLKKESQIQQTSLERLAAQLDQVRNLFLNAQALAYDTLQVFNQSLQISIQMEQSQRDLRLLNLQMARLLDLSEVRPLAELVLPTLPTAVLHRDSVKQIARQQRPELRGVSLAQQAAQLNRKLARGNYFPEIGAEARYYYAKPGVNPFANEWMDYATLGMNLQWNLWRWNQDRHRMQTAEVEFNRLQLEEEELLRAIDYEVEKSWENMQLAAQQNRLAERLLAQQRERYRIVITQQREGLATTNDVIIAETDLTQAESQVQRTLIQYYLAQTEMQLAAGVLGLSD